jgi:hypothetical protein
MPSIGATKPRSKLSLRAMWAIIRPNLNATKYGLSLKLAYVPHNMT